MKIKGKKSSEFVSSIHEYLSDNKDIKKTIINIIKFSVPVTDSKGHSAHITNIRVRPEQMGIITGVKQEFEALSNNTSLALRVVIAIGSYVFLDVFRNEKPKFKQQMSIVEALNWIGKKHEKERLLKEMHNLSIENMNIPLDKQGEIQAKIDKLKEIIINAYKD